jgi:hypothetical protein
MDRVYWMFDCDIDVNWATSSLGNGQSLVEVQYLAFTPIAYDGGALLEDEKAESALKEMALSIRGDRRGSSRAQTVLAICLALAKRSSYGGGKMAHTPAGVLLSGHGRMGNCEGYARTFFCLCKKLGIPVVYVESRTHAFTYVQLENGAWYGVDPCWADVGSDVDSRWILYGSAAARSGDTSQSHEAYLSRYGARFIALTIARDSYGF